MRVTGAFLPAPAWHAPCPQCHLRKSPNFCREAFKDLTVRISDDGNDEAAETQRRFADMSEAAFGKLGRDEPMVRSLMSCASQACSVCAPSRQGCVSSQVMKLLLSEKERQDAAGWRAFQSSCQTLKLRRTRALSEAQELQAAIDAATRAMRLRAAEDALGAL